MVPLISIVSFVLVFLCALVALRQIEGFSGGARWLVAACSALLSALGLISFVGDSPPPIRPDFLGLMLPYAALAATLIGLLILLLLAKIFRAIRGTPRRSHHGDGRKGHSSDGHGSTHRRPSRRDRLDAVEN